MGNNSSRPLYHKVSHAIPYGHPFNGDDDRQQFVYAVIACITNNGQIDLRDHNFRLLYSRKPDDRVVARVVAEKDGIIRAKVEPVADGEDQAGAFQALRKDVEMKLEQILANVPSEFPTTVGSSRMTAPAGTSTLLSDAPPAYGSGDVKLSRKK